MTLTPVDIPHTKAMKPGAPPQASMIQKGVVSGAHNTGLCVDNEAMAFLPLIIRREGNESIRFRCCVLDTITPFQLFSVLFVMCFTINV